MFRRSHHGEKVLLYHSHYGYLVLLTGVVTGTCGPLKRTARGAAVAPRGQMWVSCLTPVCRLPLVSRGQERIELTDKPQLH